jgi:hypothetical protein
VASVIGSVNYLALESCYKYRHKNE